MKRCPSCQSTFPDTQDFCTNDGTRLVNDEAADLGKTLVAPPPPPPQSFGGEIPPTQVVNTYQGYDTQPQPFAQQTRQPSSDYALQQPPSQQQWQQPYAPPYQQQPYAPSYGAPKSNRKMLYLGIAAVAVIGGVVLLIVLLSGGKSLGTYKGSLSDLFPEKVGAYSRTTTGTIGDVVDRDLDRYARQFFSYDDASAGKYENSGKKLLLIASNFSSPDKAKDALKKIKSEIEKANNRTSLQTLDGAQIIKALFQGAETRRPIWTLKEGKSKKDGNRLVYTLTTRPDMPEKTMVIWTNGSVAFAAGPAAVFAHGSEADNASSVPSYSDILDFEKNVPY